MPISAPAAAADELRGAGEAFAGRLGARVIRQLRFAGGFGQLAAQAARDCFTRPFYPGLVLEQMQRIGIESILLVAVTALATGSVMALQFGYGLTKFGGKLYVPKIVALTILREM